MPRRKAGRSESRKTSGPAQDSNDHARPVAERLQNTVREELWLIWRTDPRVPSIRSRRAWAISRNVNPRLVDSWFLRRRTCARKAGQAIPDESYDLPLGLSITPKRKQSAIPIELEAIPDLPSDDTLVYPPDSDKSNDMEASSDTVFDVEDTPTWVELPVYREVYHQLPSYGHHQIQPEPSFVETGAAKYHCRMATSFEDSSSLFIRNLGQEEQPGFACTLCAEKTAQDEILYNYVSKSSTGVSYPRLEFLPDTLSELSAIPFLFRTPTTVFSDNAIAHQSAHDWTIVEDELRRLVNDGNLDFSFLDAPDLTSMELPD